MQPSFDPAKQSLLESLRTKLLVYSDHLDLRNSGSEKAQRLRFEANNLFAQGKLTLLRAWAKEVDVWIRETLEPNEQEIVAQAMKREGVLSIHLPKTLSVAAAKRILKRNAIRNEVDLSVVRSTLDSNGFGHLSQDELMQLGQLFDEYTVKPPT